MSCNVVREDFQKGGFENTYVRIGKGVGILQVMFFHMHGEYLRNRKITHLQMHFMKKETNKILTFSF